VAGPGRTPNTSLGPSRTPQSSRAISEHLEIISGHLGAPRNHLGPSPRDDFETLRDGPRWPEMTSRCSERPEMIPHPKIISGHLGAPRNHLGPSRSTSESPRDDFEVLRDGPPAPAPMWDLPLGRGCEYPGVRFTRGMDTPEEQRRQPFVHGVGSPRE